LDHLFAYLQPFIFGTAGAEINLHVIQASMIWKSCVIVSIAVPVRFIISFLVCFSRFYHNLRLTCKEQLFVALVWCVKGSVQAILSYEMLNQVQTLHLGEPYRTHGYQMLTLGFVSIMLTSPALSVVIYNLGPKLLVKEEVVQLAMNHMAKLDLETLSGEI
jgi:hypothetical protein